jgi:hypothetical protein
MNANGMTTTPDLPPHIARALDALSVRTPPKPLPPITPVDAWWKRGEECPF